MLDIEYKCVADFVADCAMCGYSSVMLLESGEYVLLDGRVISSEMFI